MDLEEDKTNVKEIKTIKTSERYQDFKKVFKYGCYLLLFILILYGSFRAFGLYIFGSFTISILFSMAFFLRLTIIEYDYSIEYRVELLKDNSKIPHVMMKEFTTSGETTLKFMSSSGKSKSVVRKIDFDNKHIEYHWFSEISEWEFLISQKTFNNLTDMLKECYDQIVKNKMAREIYQSREFVRTLDFTEKDMDTRDLINAELKTKLNKMFPDKKETKKKNKVL